MAAALGENLILEDDAGGAGALELLHAAHDVVQVAVTGVAVGDDRDRHAVRHAPHGVGHLLHAEEVQVRQAVEAGAGAEAADEHRLEPGLLDQHRRQHVVGAQRADDAGHLHQFPQPAGGFGLLAHAILPLA